MTPFCLINSIPRSRKKSEKRKKSGKMKKKTLDTKNQESMPLPTIYKLKSSAFSTGILNEFHFGLPLSSQRS